MLKRSFLALRKSRIVLYTVILAIILIIFCFLDFRKQVDLYIEDDMYSQIKLIQESSTLLIQNEMRYLKHITASMAQIMSHADIQTDEEIIQTLKDYAETSNIVQTFFVTLDGNVYTNYAGNIGKHDEAAMVDDIPIAQITEAIFTQPYYAEDLDAAVVGVAAPTTVGEKRGILVSAYNVSELSELLDNELIGEAAGLGIINNKGEVITGKTNDEFMINIIDSLQNVDFVSSSVNIMKEDLANGKSGFCIYRWEGVARYCSYMPIGENNWYLITAVRESSLRSKLASLEQYGVQLTMKLVMIMLGLLCVIIVNRMVEQKRVRKTLEDAAKMDGLTGIYNRKAIEENIEEYLQPAGKDVRGALLVIDIDDFKKINDKEGHLFGDTVLKECAGRLSRMFDDMGLVGRIGGDEFVVFLYDDRNMKKIEEKINDFINDFCVVTDTGQKKEVSLSVGIAHAGVKRSSFLVLYKMADDALYRAKQSGKSRLSE